jgi:hypothetical protein
MNSAQFTAALLDPAAPLPQGLVDPQGRAAPRRFDVYRNNVTLGLIRVLEAGFPATRALVGDAFFAAMAGEYARACPPQTRIMMLYGDDFADFIAQFPPAASLGYLPDVARLEQAIRLSYHAADAMRIDPLVFATLSEADLQMLRLRFAPAVRIVASPWPILGIWAANMRGAAPPHMAAEAVIVMRPDFDPLPSVLPHHSLETLRALIAGAKLGAALHLATGPFDLSELLKLLLTGGAIVGINQDDR